MSERQTNSYAAVRRPFKCDNCGAGTRRYPAKRPCSVCGHPESDRFDDEAPTDEDVGGAYADGLADGMEVSERDIITGLRAFAVDARAGKLDGPAAALSHVAAAFETFAGLIENGKLRGWAERHRPGGAS